MLELISEIDKNQKQALDVVQDDQNQALANWINNSGKKMWNSYFLRWLRFKKSEALFHFNDLEMDICVIILNLEDPEFGKQYNLKLVNVDLSTNALTFELG